MSKKIISQLILPSGGLIPNPNPDYIPLMKIILTCFALVTASVSLLNKAYADNAAIDAPKASETTASTITTSDIGDWRLENGLRVIHVPMHHTPAVSVHVWYHTGSKNERVGIRGIAHLFEHMMFKGSKHLAPEKYAQYISAVGGDSNAFTSQDVTAYHQEVPKAHLEKVLELEAERMANLTISEKTIASEREVVKEEKRLRMENSPIGRALEALYDLAYTTHPYRWTPAGNMKDLANITIADCEAFYCTHYRPNNATLIVAGDVDESTLRKLALTYFGPISGSSPHSTCPPQPQSGSQPSTQAGRRSGTVDIEDTGIPQEPAPTGPKIKRADWPSQVPVVIGGYPIPPAKHVDMAAIEVLSYILSSGQSSRLHKALVRKERIAMAAGGFARDMEHRGLFLVYAIGLPTSSTEALVEALDAQIARVRKNGVSANDILKAKNQLATNFLEQLETIDGVAEEIGRSTYVLGDPTAFMRYASRLQAVSADDVARVANTYLNPNHITRIDVPTANQMQREKATSASPQK